MMRPIGGGGDDYEKNKGNVEWERGNRVSRAVHRNVEWADFDEFFATNEPSLRPNDIAYTRINYNIL